MSSRRITWIDTARAIAITAVVADHAWYLFTGTFLTLFQRHMFFSVSWFIFLTAVTSMAIVGKASRVDWPMFWRKRIRLFLWYAVVSAGLVVINDRMADPVSLITAILKFSAIPPFYYLFVLFQLFLLFPLLYTLMKRKNPAANLAIFAISVVIAVLVRDNSGNWRWTMENVLIGGPYLPVFVAGMLYSRYPKAAVYADILAVPVFLVLETLFFQSGGETVGFVPTAVSVTWGISMMLTVKTLIRYSGKAGNGIGKILAPVGRSSFTVFLLHYPVLQVLGKMGHKTWPAILAGILTAILLPMLCERILGSVWGKIREPVTDS